MKIFNKVLLILVALLLIKAKTSEAQIAVVAPDGNYFAVSYNIELPGMKFKKGMNLYDFKTQEFISNMSIDFYECSNVSDIIFANSNKSIFLRSNNCNFMGGLFDQYTMWDISKGLEGKKIDDFTATTAHSISFSGNGSYFALHSPKEDTYIQIVDSKNGNSLVFFEFKRGVLRDLKKIAINHNGDMVTAQIANEFVVMKKRDTKFKKNLELKNLLFTGKSSKLLAFSSEGELQLLENEKFTPTKKSLAAQSFLSGFDHALTNPSGNFTAIPTANSILIIDNATLEKVNQFDGFTNIIKIVWKDDKELCIDQAENSKVVNIITAKELTNAEYSLKFSKIDPNISLQKQVSDRILSLDRKYMAINTIADQKNVFYYRNTESGKNYTAMYGYKFIGFSRDNKYGFIENAEGEASMIDVKILEETSISRDLPFEALINPITMGVEGWNRYLISLEDERKRQELKTKGLLSVENLVEQDRPPKEYISSKLNEFIDIKKANIKNLYVNLRNIESKNTEVEINVHLTDAKGNFYFGAGNDKNIWKKLTLKDPDGKTIELTDFEVIEHSYTDSVPTASVLIMDMSGSMGEERAKLLQEGAIDVVHSKRPIDAMSVLKYDSYVKYEAKLSKNNKHLSSKIKVNGLEGFGAQTALYDAIDEGRFILRNLKGYGKKSIFILTDGNENASKIDKNKAILNALKRDINVYTIGFGRKVSGPNLQSIAYSTGGAYYHIYNSDELKWIFNDVYHKSLSYYTIKFKTKTTGKHVAKLEIHYDEKYQDDLLVAFDNTQRKIETVKEDGDDGFGVPLKDIDPTDVKKKEFAAANVMEEQKQLISATGSNLDFIIDREFKAIDFPDTQFQTNTATIVEGTEKGIEEVIDFVQVYPDAIVEIEGHTDNAGEPDFNMKLSLLRANTIKDLIIKGAKIDEKRIIPKGFGETKPLASNDTEEGKAKNRRVVFKLIKF